MDEHAAKPQRSDWAELEDLKAIFLDRVPDFRDFQQREGIYYDVERRYKDEILQRVQEITASDGDEATTGQQIYLALMPKDGPFLRWQTNDDFHRKYPELASEFHSAIARLARSQASLIDAVAAAGIQLEDLRARGASVLTVGQAMGIVITVAGFARPTEAAPFKMTRARELAERLTGDRLFFGNRVDRGQLEKWFALLNRIRGIMRDVWAWQPRDLFDVQGFAWVALGKKWLDDEDNETQLTRAAVLASIEECEQLGREGFLAEYQFGEPAKYWLVEGGSYYPAKAIANVAHRYVENGKVERFGATRTRKMLIQLGFDVTDDRTASSVGEPAPREATESTNLILFGPPGTGKTYRTIDEAVRLCDGLAPGDRKELTARYGALVEAGQIAFVTFHQSYSYEDFVEGLRPVTGEDDEQRGVGGFQLVPRKGIFREIAALAEQARRSVRREGEFDLAGRRFFKMSLGRAGVEDEVFEAAIEGGYIVLGWGGEVDWASAKYNEYQAIHDKWNEIQPGTSGNDSNIAQTFCFRGKMRDGDIVVVSDGNSHFRAIGEVAGPYRFERTGVGTYNHKREVRWLLVLDESLPVDSIHDGPFSQRSCYPLKESRVRKEAIARLLPGEGQSVATVPDQFVLIIDEINRANISKVFGELITLLEPDKRLGGKHPISLKLPYSGDTFGIPANLHIVATMNTADRSIALLDTALRRRFDFKELMPEPDLLPQAVGGIPLRAMLTTINARIEFLFDREHQIGHAYFIQCTSRADVDRAMRGKVIPLLQEYFYEDWVKVALVLGDTGAVAGAGAFLVAEELSPPPGFEADGEPRLRWRVRDVFTADAYDRFQ